MVEEFGSAVLPVLTFRTSVILVPIGVEPHKRQHAVSMSVISPWHLTKWVRLRPVDRQLQFLVPLVRVNGDGLPRRADPQEHGMDIGTGTEQS